MMEREQVRPLAPASDRPSSDDEYTAENLKQIRRRKFIKCCGCISSILIIQIVVVIILIFTVFKIKDPIIKMNGVTVDQLDLINGTTPRPGSNMSLTADVSVKNPNYASFRFSNTTTTVYYHGTVIGEARGPGGKSKARRTMRMNITVDVITDNLISQPSLSSDMSTGLITMTTYTKVGGRVKLIKIVKKHVTVRMNCSIAINITNQAIQNMKCKRKVDL